jgi:hypothetical protein
MSNVSEHAMLSAFGYAVALIGAGALVAAALSLVVAGKRNTLALEDIGSLVLVPAAFFVIGSLRNDLHTGFALIFWPIIIAVIVAYSFSLKVWVVDTGRSNARLTSRALFWGSIVASSVAALLVPPWYE